MIKDQIRTITEHLDALEQLVVGAAAAAASTQAAADANMNKQTSSHSQVIVKRYQDQMKTVTLELQGILQTRAKNMKEVSARSKMFGANSSSALRKRPHTASVFALEAPGSVGGGAGAGSGGAGGDEPDIELGLSGSAAAAMQAQSLQRGEDQDVYLEGRARAIQSIDSTLKELSVLYQRLATIISEQGEMAERIDANVEETLHNVEGAHTELLKYFDRISSNRWLIIKVFAILILFAIFFTLFMA